MKLKMMDRKKRDRKWIKNNNTHIFKLFLFKKTWNLFFGSNWVYTMNQGPWAIGHGFSHGLIQKVRYHEVLLTTAKGFSCKPLLNDNDFIDVTILIWQLIFYLH
jgi:hypothetical protein